MKDPAVHAYGHILGLGLAQLCLEYKDEESADEEDIMLEEAQVLVLESHNSDAILKASTVYSIGVIKDSVPQLLALCC